MTTHNKANNTTKDAGGSKKNTSLMFYITCIENLDKEAMKLREARKKILAQAKDVGYNTRIIEKVVSARKQDPATLVGLSFPKTADGDKLAEFMKTLGLD